MTKKDLKDYSNEQLIRQLCLRFVRSSKNCVGEAKMICRELGERGVLDGDRLFKLWSI